VVIGEGIASVYKVVNLVNHPQKPDGALKSGIGPVASRKSRSPNAANPVASMSQGKGIGFIQPGTWAVSNVPKYQENCRFEIFSVAGSSDPSPFKMNAGG
jgi:hypothetical protein